MNTQTLLYDIKQQLQRLEFKYEYLNSDIEEIKQILKKYIIKTHSN